MKFSALLLEAIGRSEIPLRFEPGADEAVAAPVTELLRVWIQSHAGPVREDGRNRLIQELLDELDGTREVPT